jgi:hypothetical protein
VRSLKADGGAVVSTLEKGTRRHLVIVNRDFTKPMSLELAFDPGIKVAELRKDGAVHPVESDSFASSVPPGDAVIFVWEAEKNGGG